MASCSSSLASHRLKYDVFLNFRGDDTRRGFTSHLYAALRRQALQTFFDDDDLKRGEEISQSLPQAIQYSSVAILVFSKDYASSRWCLDELAEIMERHRSHGQVVIPIFYDVDPSHLRKQSHDVAAAFVKHEQNPMNAHKIPRWKDALIKAASLSGFDSKNFGNDDLLIKKIVEDILEKLNQSMPCDDFEHLVGMDSRIKKIKEVFTINPFETHIFGIWGMGGIGKTTTAEVVYKMISHQFEGGCILYDVRQKAEASGINKLQEELILKALGEKVSGNYGFNASLDLFLKRRLGRMKVIIVLDDVNNSQQIESLIGDPCWFGSGSMILITSRDKQVFKRWTDFIYEVKSLNYDEALQLFRKMALKQNDPRDDFALKSESFVKYTQGSPLALKVLGSHLNGRNHEEWESELTLLSEFQNVGIQQVLRISYNGLSMVEKRIFLDIACFFKQGEIYDEADILRKIYRGFDIALSVLVDKCLVTSKDSLGMHDLIQEMGKAVVLQNDKQEHVHPYQRTRLWNHEDIYQILVENMEAIAVETITLDLSKIREMNLNPQVFTRMPYLRLLNVYGESNLHLSQGLDSLPNALQYLRWEKYPLEYLPPNSQPKNLVVLELPNSNIKQLWKRVKEDSLLSQVKYEIVNSFRRLTSLSIVQNKNITCLPNSKSGFLEALEVLDLCGCSNLNTFPEISSNIKNLYLSETAIKQVPSSAVELLSKLEYLEMRDCREFESLPSNFFRKLTSLCILDLSRCSRFKMLPEILGPRSQKMFLYLTKTGIEKLPSFIGNFSGSWSIDMRECLNLAFYPRSPENFLSEDSYWFGELILGRCNFRESPEDVNFPSFITTLILWENDFERIPASLKQLSRLKYLNISNCKNLLSLPELPPNVYKFVALDCWSLKEIGTLKQLSLDARMTEYNFDLSNCLKLDEDQCQEVVNVLLRNYTRSQMLESLANFRMMYPGSRIPKWVKHRWMGDSIQIRLPSDWFTHLFLGFAFYLCYYNGVYGYNLRYDCHFGDNYHFSSSIFLRRVGIDKEHMGVFIDRKFCEWVDRHSDFENFKKGVAFFKFTEEEDVIIKKCGVIPLYAQNDKDKFCGTFDFPNLGVSKVEASATFSGTFYAKKRLTIEEVE